MLRRVATVIFAPVLLTRSHQQRILFVIHHITVTNQHGKQLRGPAVPCAEPKQPAVVVPRLSSKSAPEIEHIAAEQKHD